LSLSLTLTLTFDGDGDVNDQSFQPAAQMQTTIHGARIFAFPSISTIFAP